MYVKVDKITEDQNWIYYKFYEDDHYIKIIEDGKIKAQNFSVYGYCKFNKITGEFIVDETKTDPHFLKQNKGAAIVIGIRLLNYKKNNLAFPARFDIATG